MMGIGTPSRKSKIERIVKASSIRLIPVKTVGGSEEPLNQLHVIPLPTTNGRRITRAKCANQESNKYPQRCVGYCSARVICRLLNLRKGFGDPFLSVCLAEPVVAATSLAR